MRLYLSDMLVKAVGAPPSGGSPKGPSAPRMRLNLAPKTPGAATPGSGPQVVDCPLGAACPDGGKHQMGSQTLQEHQKQAQTQGMTGQKVGDESQGKESGKPGVPPGAANIGGVGSDQVQPPEPKQGTKPSTGHLQTVADEWRDWDNFYDSPRPSLESHLRNNGVTNEQDIDSLHSALKQKRKTKNDVTPPTRDVSSQADPTRQIGSQEVPVAPNAGDVDERQTLPEFEAPASDDAVGEPPSSKRRTLPDSVERLDPESKRQNVPNPMVADESMVPPDSKPMDHYKLSKIAKESGDEDLAKFHEGMARKRTEGMGSEDHKQLADQLHAEGLHEHAEYHAGIHQRVQEQQPESKVDQKSHEESMRDVHHEQRTKAAADLEAAKKKHEETKTKAENLRAKNAERQKAFEESKAAHEKAKAEGKAGKPPEKPKLEKEEKVPEKPELSAPESDADKLRHEGHTEKAKRLADIAESHLRGNTKLSSTERSRLERAHKMAVYHSNIGYTPTAAHKKELGEVEQAMSGLGVKEHHDEIRAAEDAKTTAAAAKAADKDRATAEKQQAKQAKAEEKQKAAEAKEQQKLAAKQPKPPQTSLDHARVADHKAKAQQLRANLESHMAQNPDMSPEERAKAENVLKELDKHEQMDMIPGADHEAELKELQQLAGTHGKKQFEESATGEDSNRSTFGNAGGYVLPMIHSGRALGTGLAASATSPYGAAGHIGPQVVSYGVTGATTAGHRLLHDAGQAAKDEKDIQEAFDKEKQEQERHAKQASGKGGNSVIGRGNQ